MNNTVKAGLIALLIPIALIAAVILAPERRPSPPPTEAELIENTAWYAGKVVVPHSLNDPDSYEWISTEQVASFKEGHLTFRVTFRARNPFNAKIIGSAIVDTWKVENGGTTGVVLYFERAQ